MAEAEKGMIKKLLTISCGCVIMLIGTLQANAFFGPFRPLFPCHVGYNGFSIGGLTGGLGSFNWFSLPSSYFYTHCW